MNSETIKCRVAAREFADTVYDLMHEERNGFNIDQDKYFWEVLIGKSPLSRLLDRKVEPESKLTPMAEEEGFDFGLAKTEPVNHHLGQLPNGDWDILPGVKLDVVKIEKCSNLSFHEKKRQLQDSGYKIFSDLEIEISDLGKTYTQVFIKKDS